MRRSTDILAIDKLAVARALRFIADHYANPQLGVKEVVKASGLSRRPLEKLFQRELRRTLNTEILQTRLAKAQHLLENTSLKIHEISTATGFTRDNHLFRSFRQRFGVTPRAYRQQKRPTNHSEP